MNRTIFTLAAFSLLAFTGMASAQNPYADHNRAREYAHFANSQAPVKSFSSIDAARTWGYDTPFESVRFYQSPGYYNEVANVRLGRSYTSDPGTVSGVIALRYPFPIQGPVYPWQPSSGAAFSPSWDPTAPGQPSSGIEVTRGWGFVYPGLTGTDYRSAGQLSLGLTAEPGLTTVPGASYPIAPAVPAYPHRR